MQLRAHRIGMKPFRYHVSKGDGGQVGGLDFSRLATATHPQLGQKRIALSSNLRCLLGALTFQILLQVRSRSPAVNSILTGFIALGQKWAQPPLGRFSGRTKFMRQGPDFTQVQFQTTNLTFHLPQNIPFDLDIFHTMYKHQIYTRKTLHVAMFL